MKKLPKLIHDRIANWFKRNPEFQFYDDVKLHRMVIERYTTPVSYWQIKQIREDLGWTREPTRPRTRPAGIKQLLNCIEKLQRENERLKKRLARAQVR